MEQTNPSDKEAFAAQWQRVETMLEERFGKVPDMEGMLYLIGINEYGLPPARGKWSKEEKEDLMHVGVCTLLVQEGYYRHTATDTEGWPHFEALREAPGGDMASQEAMLKRCIIRYFGID